MWPFKKKHYVKVSYTGQTAKGVGLMIDCRTDPQRGMGMLLGALQDMAERFQKTHNARPNPCDCMGIRYANLIIHHISVINNEMSKVKLKK